MLSQSLDGADEATSKSRTKRQAAITTTPWTVSDNDRRHVVPLRSAAVSETYRRPIFVCVACARSTATFSVVGTVRYFDGPPAGRVSLSVSVLHLRC